MLLKAEYHSAPALRLGLFVVSLALEDRSPLLPPSTRFQEMIFRYQTNAMNKRQTRLEVLPPELFMEILSYLGVKALTNARLVSSHWNEFIMSEACDRTCWQRLTFFYYPEEDNKGRTQTVWRSRLQDLVKYAFILSPPHKF